MALTMRLAPSLPTAAASLICLFALPASAALIPVDMVSYAVRSGDDDSMRVAGVEVGSDVSRFTALGTDGTPLQARASGGVVVKTRSNVRNNRSMPGANLDAWLASSVAGNWTFMLDDQVLTGSVPAAAVTGSIGRPYAQLDAASRSAVSAWAAAGGTSLELNLASAMGLDVSIGLYNTTSDSLSLLGKITAGSTGISLNGLKNPVAGLELVLMTESNFSMLPFTDAAQQTVQIRYWEVAVRSYAVPTPGAAALVAIACMSLRRRRHVDRAVPGPRA